MSTITTRSGKILNSDMAHYWIIENLKKNVTHPNLYNLIDLSCGID